MMPAGTAAPGPGLRRLFWPGLLVLLAFAILVGLGTWQLQRLAWKQAILARIADRIAAAPVDLPPEADWPRLVPEDYEYRRVRLTGVFEHDKEALVFRPAGLGAASGAGPGYLVLTPLRLDSGARVIVDRGFVPLDRKQPESRAAGEIGGVVTITGLMRSPESRNLFTPADDPARGQWYTRDPSRIAAYFKLDRTAPFTVDADAGAAPGGWPVGGQTVIDIPNNHLSYALTWYGLAAALLVVFALRAFGRRPG
jgi:surfeit locus 1 family protein